jgi:hypothetical protein
LCRCIAASSSCVVVLQRHLLVSLYCSILLSVCNSNCLGTSLRNLRHFRYPRSCLRSNKVDTFVRSLGPVECFIYYGTGSLMFTPPPPTPHFHTFSLMTFKFNDTFSSPPPPTPPFHPGEVIGSLRY